MGGTMVNTISYENFCTSFKKGAYYKFKYKEFDLIFNFKTKGYFRTKLQWSFSAFKHSIKKPLFVKKYKNPEVLIKNTRIADKSLHEIWNDLEFVCTDFIKLSFENFCSNLKEGAYYEFKYKEYLINIGLKTKGMFVKKTNWLYYMYKHDDTDPMIVSSYKTLELMLDNVYIFGKKLAERWDELENLS